MARPKLYDDNSKCVTKGCDNKPIAKGLCMKCWQAKRRGNTQKQNEARKTTGRLSWQIQESYPITDQDNQSFNAISAIRITYTGSITIDSGIFLGYPHHCMFIKESVNI